MVIQSSGQKALALFLIAGSGFLLFRTLSMIFIDHAYELFVGWVFILLVIEMLFDLSCLYFSIRWFLKPVANYARKPLKLVTCAILIHAFRVLIYVLGRMGPWYNFDVRPERHASYAFERFWVYFAGIMSIIGVIAVIVGWWMINIKGWITFAKSELMNRNK